MPRAVSSTCPAVQKIAELFLIELVSPTPGDQRAGVRQLRAPVVERDVEEQAGVSRRPLNGVGELVLDVGGQLLRPPDHAEADVVLEERSELEPQVTLEQRHERAHFGFGPLPVLHRERVDGEHVEAEPGRGFDDVADRVDAGAVAFDARQVAFGRPAAVAVHDDRDVCGQLFEVHLPGQRLFGRAGRQPREQLV